MAVLVTQVLSVVNKLMLTSLYGIFVAVPR